MYTTLLFLHSFVRWLVLVSLLFTIYKAFHGWFAHKSFSRTDNTIRHITATIVHVQFLIGVVLYIISPVVRHFLQSFDEAVKQSQFRFFGLEHSLMMFIAVIAISIGSSKAKRLKSDQSKFKVVAIWYMIGLIIILISIPWPFSPLANRPYFRLL